MTSRGHGPRPEDPEEDPTGVRELLSGLPDPGPMPDHVAQRIAATLEGHDQQRGWQSVAPQASAPLGAHARSADGTDADALFAPERSRSRWGRALLTAAATVVAVGVVGGVGYDRVMPPGEAPDAAAQYVPAGNARPGDSSAEEPVSEVSPVTETPSTSSDAELDALDAVAQLDEQTFSAGAGAVLQQALGGPAPRSLPAAFEVIDAEARALPAQETDSCVRATGESPQGSGWVAAPATVAGTSVVVVSDRHASEPQVWAVSAECVADASAAVLHGPTDLP